MKVPLNNHPITTLLPASKAGQLDPISAGLSWARSVLRSPISFKFIPMPWRASGRARSGCPCGLQQGPCESHLITGSQVVTIGMCCSFSEVLYPNTPWDWHIYLYILYIYIYICHTYVSPKQLMSAPSTRGESSVLRTPRRKISDLCEPRGQSARLGNWQHPFCV